MNTFLTFLISFTTLLLKSEKSLRNKAYLGPSNFIVSGDTRSS